MLKVPAESMPSYPRLVLSQDLLPPTLSKKTSPATLWHLGQLDEIILKGIYDGLSSLLIVVGRHSLTSSS